MTIAVTLALAAGLILSQKEPAAPQSDRAAVSEIGTQAQFDAALQLRPARTSPADATKKRPYRPNLLQWPSGDSGGKSTTGDTASSSAAAPSSSSPSSASEPASPYGYTPPTFQGLSHPGFAMPGFSHPALTPPGFAHPGFNHPGFGF